jgi:hypothetical protein
MKLFTQGRYATVAATAALVVALGGTSYAAAQITSLDIKDGTIQTVDLSPAARSNVKQVKNDSGTGMDGSNKTVLTMNLPKGSYQLTGKVNVYASAGGYAECWLTGPSGNTLDYGWYYSSAATGYGQVVNTSVVKLGSTGTVQLNCYGSSATVDGKRLAATRVAGIANLTGANVSKVPTHTIAPTR